MAVAGTARICEANGRGVYEANERGGVVEPQATLNPQSRSRGHLGVGDDDGGEIGGVQVALRRRKDLPRRHRLDGGLVLEQVVLHPTQQAS